jgi:hypothetical protein
MLHDELDLTSLKSVQCVFRLHSLRLSQYVPVQVNMLMFNLSISDCFDILELSTLHTGYVAYCKE